MDEVVQPPTVPQAPPAPQEPPQEASYGKKNWIKWLLIIIIVAILSSAATFLIATSQVGKQPPPTPTVMQPTPTPDPTANWKTYTNQTYGFTIKYPPTFSIEDVSSKSPPFSIFIKDTTIQVPFEGGTMINPYILVDIKPEKLSLDDYLATYPNLKVQEKKTINGTVFTKVEVTMGITQPPMYLASINGNILGISNFYLNEQTFDQIFSTFKFTDQKQTWKVFEGKNFSMSYPSNWIIDNSYPDQYDAAFKSSDYADDGGMPMIISGFTVRVWINKGYSKGFSDNQVGLKTSTEITLLGKKAKLDKIDYEGLYYSIHTDKNSGLDIAISIWVPSEAVFEKNKEDILKAANSIVLK